MHTQFWLDVWDSKQIGFDQKAVNPLLAKHMACLNLSAGSRVFVPLCGKSIDMVWLLKQGYQVVGVELSQDAIEQFFSAMGLQADVAEIDGFIRYSAPDIDIFVGDYFVLTAKHIKSVDAIYDRASLVALPSDMRSDYCQHLQTISHKAPQLLITFNYNQSLQNGPPFSISEDEVKHHYAQHYRCSLLDSVEVAGGLKGGCPAVEQVWHLDLKRT